MRILPKSAQSLLMACAALFFAFGCSRSEPEASEERRSTAVFDLVGRVVNPDIWNPFLPASNKDHGFHQAMIEPLFILNLITNEIEPWLGLSMSANASLDEWTLELRPGVRWSDGVPFTSRDVVFTVEMLIENAPTLYFSGPLAQWVERVEAIDDLTVKFFLTSSNPRFQLDYWAVKTFHSVYIVPWHIWKDQDPQIFRNYDPEKGWPVFTGPYNLEGFTGTEFVYKRDEDWWGAESGWKPLPAPETLIWVWYGPEETRTAAAAEGLLDSLRDISLGAYQALLQRRPEFFAWLKQPPYAWTDPCQKGLDFNHLVPPWNDSEMRWAINYAIDRDLVVTVALEGTSIPSRSIYPAYPKMDKWVDYLEKRGLYEKYPMMLHDPQKARRIIESKGYELNRRGTYEKEGKTLSLVITTHESYIMHQRIARVIVEQLQDVGINATHRNEAGGTWYQNLQLGQFEATIGWLSCGTGSVTEPWTSLDTFSATWLKPLNEPAQSNWWRWENWEFSEIVAEMGSLALDDPRIEELFYQAMDIWMAELPIIPVAQGRQLVPFSGIYWEGWPTAENNFCTPRMWTQAGHLTIHNLRRVDAPKADLETND